MCGPGVMKGVRSMRQSVAAPILPRLVRYMIRFFVFSSISSGCVTVRLVVGLC